MQNTFYVKKEVDFLDLVNFSWAGAVDTLEIIQYYGMEEELIDLLKEVYYKGVPEISAINDFLWFDSSFICESLGIDVELYYEEKDKEKRL